MYVKMTIIAMLKYELYVGMIIFWDCSVFS